MSAPLQRAKLSFGAGCGSLQGRAQWLSLPVESLQSISALVARETNVSLDKIELHLQDCLLPRGSDPRLIRDGELVVASVRAHGALSSAKQPAAMASMASIKPVATKRKQQDSSSSSSSSDSDSSASRPSASAPTKAKKAAARKAGSSPSSSSSSSSSSSDDEHKRDQAKRLKKPAASPAFKPSPAAVAPSVQAVVAASPAFLATKTGTTNSAAIPAHIPLPPPFPLRSPLPSNPALTLPGLPLPLPVPASATATPAVAERSRKEKPVAPPKRGNSADPKRGTVTTYVKFDDDGKVQEERAAAAPLLSREHIQAQKRRGSAVPSGERAGFNRGHERRGDQLRAEEGEIAPVDAEMEDGEDEEHEPSLNSVGSTGQRAYETLPALEGLPAAGDSIAWLSMQFDFTSASGMTTSWREATVRSSNPTAKTVVFCGGAGEPDFEVAFADLSSVRRITGTVSVAPVVLAPTPATAPTAKESGQPPPRKDKRVRAKIGGIGRLIARLQKDVTPE